MTEVRPPCIFVIGMHRSGTSATTGTLGALGLALPQGDDLLAPRRGNERGIYESKNVIRLNNYLLGAVGGTWSAPPKLKPEWETDPTLNEIRSKAKVAFAESFPTRPMAAKDPRFCITLPFWRSVVEPPLAAVFIYRDPLEVARSLQARSDLGVFYGLALWDRHVRSACANLVGIPTIATSFSKTTEQPAVWVDELADFLDGVGAPVDPSKRQAAIDLIDTELRHQRTLSDRTSGVWDSQFELFDVLREVDGVHPSWRVPDIGPEPEWVDEVLELRLDGDRFRRMQKLMQTSRAFRFTQMAWKVTHGGRTTVFEDLMAERRAAKKARRSPRDQAI
jgi:hypothetical protein